jgi:guanylate kinase
VDGEDYYFVDERTFLDMANKGFFLEHAAVFGNFYGTSTAQLQRALDSGSDLILEIDWQGARVVRQAYPAAVSIFVLPPSESALRERLLERGRDALDVIDARMRSALAEMSHFDEYEYLLINDDFDAALQELCTVVLANRYKTASRRHRLGPLLGSLIASASVI